MQLVISKAELVTAAERINKRFKFEMHNGGGYYMIEPEDVAEAIFLALTSVSDKEAEKKIANLYNEIQRMR